MLDKHGWREIDNGNIRPDLHVGRDGIHLNEDGVRFLARNLISHLRGVTSAAGDSGIPRTGIHLPMPARDLYSDIVRNETRPPPVADSGEGPGGPEPPPLGKKRVKTR